jgi:hypothetical protein
MISVHNLHVVVAMYQTRVQEAKNVSADEKEKLSNTLDGLTGLACSGYMPRALVAIGILQSSLCRLGLLTHEEMGLHVDMLSQVGDSDPPHNLPVVTTKLLLPFACSNCHSTLFRMAKTHWMPANLHLDTLMFKPFDPEKRLENICGVGIHVDFSITQLIWDYCDNTAIAHMRHVVLHPDISEEAVALAVNLLQKAGWAYTDNQSREWPKRWEAHRKPAKMYDPCPIPGNPATMLGEMIGDMFSQGKKKKKKRKPDHGESPSAEGDAN